MSLPEPAASRAVLIGVHDYTHLAALGPVRNNVPALKELLTDPGVLGLPEEHCLDRTQPTEARQLLDEIHTVAGEATDTLLVYYAGHGLINLREGRSLHLALPDSPREGQWYRSLSYAHIRDAVAASPALHKIVILDCCYSGRALNEWMSADDGPHAPGGGADGGVFEAASVAEQIEIERSFVLTATAEDELALCPAGERHSALTGALVAVLRDGVPGSQPTLAMDTVYEHVYAALREQDRPLPQQGLRNRGSKIVLARNRAYGGGQPPARLDTLIALPHELVGREREIAHLTRLAAEPAQGRTDAVCVVHGMGGMGKTALLREVASRVADRFTDARFEVDLQGWSPGQQPRTSHRVLGELLAECGTPPDQIPSEPAARAERWRSWLAGRRVLLLLDNAHDVQQVRPLLPGPQARCLTLISSRSRLPGLSRHELAVGELSEQAAVALLREVGDGCRAGATDDELAEIARLCGRLPLALRPVGGLLGDIPAGTLLAAMRGPYPLRHIPDAGEAVRLAFSASYERLPEDLRDLLRVCARHPGPDFGRDSVEAMATLPEGVASIGLGRLVQGSMLLAQGGRLAFHDLFLGHMRAAAAGAAAPAGPADPADPAAGARQRLYAYLLERVEAVDATLEAPVDGGGFADTGAALEWLAERVGELESAASAALEDGWEHALHFAHTVSWRLMLHDWTAQARAVLDATLVRARARGDRSAQAHTLASLGDVARVRCEYGTAEEQLGEALRLFREEDERLGTAGVLKSLGDVARGQGRDADAEEALAEALRLYAEEDDRLGRADVHKALGDLATARGDFGTAAEQLARALALYRETNNRMGQANTLGALASVAYQHDASSDAEAQLAEALRLHLEIGDRLGQMNVLERLALLAAHQGDTEGELRRLGEALEMAAKILAPDNPRAVRMRERLDELCGAGAP